MKTLRTITALSTLLVVCAFTQPAHTAPVPDGLSPIAPTTPDKPFESAVKDLVDASGNEFISFRGTANFPPETDGEFVWHLSVSKRDVPGFQNGLIRTHTNDGNYYDMGDYVEYENRDHWPAGKDADARIAFREVSGKIVDALGPQWSTDTTYHAVGHKDGVELDRKFTRPSESNFIELRLVTNRKGNDKMFLDVSDGHH